MTSLVIKNCLIILKSTNKENKRPYSVNNIPTDGGLGSDNKLDSLETAKEKDGLSKVEPIAVNKLDTISKF